MLFGLGLLGLGLDLSSMAPINGLREGYQIKLILNQIPRTQVNIITIHDMLVELYLGAIADNKQVSCTL